MTCQSPTCCVHRQATVMAESIRMHAAATFYGEREWQPDGRRWLEDALWARVQVRYLIFSPLGTYQPAGLLLLQDCICLLA